MNTNLLVNYSVSGGKEYDLIIEQEPWDPQIGIITKANFIKYLQKLLYGDVDGNNVYEENSECGVTDGLVQTAVWVFPAYENQPYSIDIAYGTLGEPVIDYYSLAETTQIDLSLTVNPQYPVREILGFKFYGDVYDANGSVVNPNDIEVTIVDSELRLSKKVYGTIAYAYTTVRHTYSVEIESRDVDTTIENYFSSVVYAWYDSGVKWVEIEMPPGIEAYDPNVSCLSGGTTIEPPGGGINKPVSVSADRIINYNYCSGDVVTDEEYEIVHWKWENE